MTQPPEARNNNKIIINQQSVKTTGTEKTMKNFKTPNYPLYQTTVFRDFRVMTESVAAKYPDRYAISYKKNPRDTEVVHVIMFAVSF